MNAKCEWIFLQKKRRGAKKVSLTYIEYTRERGFSKQQQTNRSTGSHARGNARLRKKKKKKGRKRNGVYAVSVYALNAGSSWKWCPVKALLFRSVDAIPDGVLYCLHFNLSSINISIAFFSSSKELGVSVYETLTRTSRSCFWFNLPLFRLLLLLLHIAF